jgi:outer membrane protein assembly factor BamB
MSESTPHEPTLDWTTTLGNVDPAGSRQRGRRSSVVVTGGTVVAGTHDGRVIAYEGTESKRRWEQAVGESVVTLAATDSLVVAGTRGTDGWIRAFDADTGTERWRHRIADDVGDPQRETRFFLPFVVDACVRDDEVDETPCGRGADGRPSVFVAGRRYERRESDGGMDPARHFESVVYAFDPGGEVVWWYGTDASAISLDADDERVAVAYNRCPGTHQCGLVVLGTDDGSLRADWDPGTDGQRRVGDVSLLPDGFAVASHGDYRGYRLDRNGDIQWTVDLGRPTAVGDERLYAYPNHVHAMPDGVVFVTGNTYPEEGREATGRHPNEHTATGLAPDGERRWTASVGGWVTSIGTDGSRLLAPVAQHFRERDPAVHGYRVFDVVDGPVRSVDADGILTAGALADGTVATVEEPVVYHDEGTERGTYRLRTESLDD